MSEPAQSKTKLTAISLALMIFTAVYGFGNVPLAFFQMGYAAIPWYIIGALAFFLPFSLMVTEFGSAFKNEKGGIYSWMAKSVSPSFALYGTLMWYMSWAIWFVTVGNRILVPISNMIFGTTKLPSTLIMSLFAIALMALVTYLSLKGLNSVKRVATIGGIAVVSLNFVMIIGAFIVLICHGFHPATGLNVQAFVTSPNPTQQPTTFVIIIAFLVYAIFAYAGVETVGGLVDETEKPEKNFPKGILLSTLIVAVGYSFMILCSGFFVNFKSDWAPKILDGTLNQGNLSYYMMQELGEKLASCFGLSPQAIHLWGSIFARYVGLAMLLALIGATFTLIYSPLKQLTEGAPEHIWPGKIGKVENGVPKNAMKVQFWIVSCLILLNLIFSLIGQNIAAQFFIVLTNMGNIASSLPYVFVVFAYIKFKQNDAIKKPFVIIKNKTLAVTIGWISALIIILADFFTIIQPIIDHVNDPQANPLSSVFTNIVPMLAGPIIFAIFAWLLIKRYRKSENKQTGR